ncbi:MAG: hypothetical protein ACP5NC_08490 [Nitrososphaeria archaeon]
MSFEVKVRKNHLNADTLEKLFLRQNGSLITPEVYLISATLQVKVGGSF